MASSQFNSGSISKILNLSILLFNQLFEFQNLAKEDHFDSLLKK